MKEERGDAAPLYLNNIMNHNMIIKNAAIQGARRNNQKCGDIISLQAFPRVYKKYAKSASKVVISLIGVTPVIVA